MLTLPLSPLQMQFRLGWWLVYRLSTSLVPGVSQLGGRFLRSLSLSLSLCLDKTNCPLLEYTAHPRPCCLDQHSSSPDWGERSSCTRFTFYQLIPPGPAHTAPSPWCCHNGNEMNCKSSTHLSYMWLRYEDVWDYMNSWIYTLWFKCWTSVASCDETSLISPSYQIHFHVHTHVLPSTTTFFWCCCATLKEWTWLGAFLRVTLKVFSIGGKCNIHFRAATSYICYQFIWFLFPQIWNNHLIYKM